MDTQNKITAGMIRMQPHVRRAKAGKELPQQPHHAAPAAGSAGSAPVGSGCESGKANTVSKDSGKRLASQVASASSANIIGAGNTTPTSTEEHVHGRRVQGVLECESGEIRLVCARGFMQFQRHWNQAPLGLQAPGP